MELKTLTQWRGSLMPAAAIAEGDIASAAATASDVMQDCHALSPCASQQTRTSDWVRDRCSLVWQRGTK